MVGLVVVMCYHLSMHKTISILSILIPALTIGGWLSSVSPVQAEGDVITDAFGANIHLRQRIPELEWNQVMTAASEGGIQWGREQFNWDVIEPSDVKPENDEQFQWDAYDGVIDAYEKAGITPVGLLTYSTSWASANSAASNYEFYPPDINAWKNYVKNVAEHYAGRVEYWEIWNEPNHSGFWQGTDAEYIELLIAAIEKIKQGNPDAKIILGGVAGTDYDYIDAVYDALEASTLADPSDIDIVAVHPYRVIGSNFNYGPEATAPGLNTLDADLRSLRAVMRRHGQGSTPVWLTEVGWTTYTDGVSDKEQAQLLMRLYTMALSIPGVEKIFWYSFTDTSDNHEFLEGHFGLIDSNYEAKPALSAMQYVQSNLTGKRFQDLTVPQAKLLDDFEVSRGWRFEEAVCTQGTVHDTTNSTMKISYRFTADGNCYAPVAINSQLESKPKVIQFKAKGDNDDTNLRMRVIDATGETFQYNLGYMPKEWQQYTVQLKSRSDSWGGNADGVLDYPISFNAFVFDDTDGSRSQGTVYIDDIVYSKRGNVYQYRFKEGNFDTYAYWSTGKKRRNLKVHLKGAGRIRVKRWQKSNPEKTSGDAKYKVRSAKTVKFLQTL